MDFCMAERKSKEVNKSELKVHDRQKKKKVKYGLLYGRKKIKRSQ